MIEKFQAAYLRHVERGTPVAVRMQKAFIAAMLWLSNDDKAKLRAWIFDTERIESTGLFLCHSASCFGTPVVWIGKQSGYCPSCAIANGYKIENDCEFRRKLTLEELLTKYESILSYSKNIHLPGWRVDNDFAKQDERSGLPF